MTRHAALFGALCAALVAAVGTAYVVLPFGRPSPAAAQALPQDAAARISAALFAARFADLDGQPQALAQWRGKTLVVNFWASWCAPCRAEMPAFSRLQARYASAGVQFVGIAIDTPHNVAAFARQVEVSYPLLVGETDGPALMRALGNVSLALPYTLLIDADGRTRLARLGRLDERELDALLAAPGPNR